MTKTKRQYKKHNKAYWAAKKNGVTIKTVAAAHQNPQLNLVKKIVNEKAVMQQAINTTNENCPLHYSTDYVLLDHEKIMDRLDTYIQNTEVCDEEMKEIEHLQTLLRNRLTIDATLHQRIKDAIN